jgi:adenosylcobinamide hydrolase
MAGMEPVLTYRRDADADLPILLWRPPYPMMSISSAALGGGLGTRQWVINVSVRPGYARLDPDAHLAEIAADLGLGGPGVGLLTAVNVADRVTAEDQGVMVTATVGLGSPTWAAAPDGDLQLRSLAAGTVNVVAWLPVRLGDAALVNAVATIAEAKAQALGELGVAATGTASDATCLLCPIGGEPEKFGGPRSTWGARLARAAHRAVLAGVTQDLGMSLQ